ncbi:MAG: ABC transporter ATP-binding protein [Acidimicrobiales bacterium]|nr:ABC transporter ATP-binding protein [Acidimicrobiales bacterium]
MTDTSVSTDSTQRRDQQEPILNVTGLKTYFFTRAGEVRAVDGVDLSLKPGEIVGLVGESGSGKSVTSMSILQLVSDPGKIVAGEVMFDGQRLDKMSKRQMRNIRGDRISMIFQQPNASLNPVFRAGEQIAEVYAAHTALKKAVRNERAVEMLEKVGIPDPASRAKAYPHELSGGMAQRVMIAMALASKPDVLIADEPTTALDVTIQAQILDLMVSMRDELGTAILLITHDLGVVAETADRVAVMYAGQIVEESPTNELFADPQHPYTQGLIGSIPMPGERRERLTVIPGRVPNLVDMPPGCRFAPRCEARIAHNLTKCTEVEPDLLQISPGRKVRCWLFEEPDPTADGAS